MRSPPYAAAPNPVTLCQTWNRRRRAVLYSPALSRLPRGQKCSWMGPKADRKLRGCPSDLDLCKFCCRGEGGRIVIGITSPMISLASPWAGVSAIASGMPTWSNGFGSAEW